MTVKNCTDMAECFLWSAFDQYNFNDLAGRIDKAVHMDRDTFRAIGITLNIAATAGYYFIHLQKLAPAWREGEPIDARKFWALKCDKTILWFSPLFLGLDLFYLTHYTEFLNPRVDWILFQGQCRLIKYTNCKISLSKFVEAFQPTGTNIIDITNHSINRVASVMSQATLGISALLAIQTIASCLLHKKFSKGDAIQLAIVIVMVAFGVFSNRCTTVDIGKDIRPMWDECYNCFNNQSRSLT